ncbi:orotidine-5'-phosphate decarboxylase [Evansella sp. AB-P1]|uniref:orotidine-5'-phosphate decarboxylase n=1 Tax=Evansella sp. AB-P1 TaxID=3037653 RepID=UPI00241C6CF0|nr:orotidine-5'-phosphate decarboxylase [Evansella sp. AB-P1]MDG5788257.1 orotidine-5'-phosphate decarboxylase [Evansella sp. AB-P1]
MQQPIIVALDFPNREEVKQFLLPFENQNLFLKVGMELFYKEGASLVHDLKSQGHRIFLDLKLHDIPTTVNRAMQQLASLEVDIVNVHAMGGVEMMKAAKEGLYAGTPSNKELPKCIAVTQLTSTSEEVLHNELYIKSTINDHVLHLCHQVKKAGLDGVVCSAQEVKMIRSELGTSFYTVTPGIRRSEDAADDQHRVVTPKLAGEYGANAIVVGRGITRAVDPFLAYKQYENEWRQN